MIESRSTSFSAIAVTCYWLSVGYERSKGEPRAGGVGEKERVNWKVLSLNMSC